MLNRNRRGRVGIRQIRALSCRLMAITMGLSIIGNAQSQNRSAEDVLSMVERHFNQIEPIELYARIRLESSGAEDVFIAGVTRSEMSVRIWHRDGKWKVLGEDRSLHVDRRRQPVWVETRVEEILDGNLRAFHEDRSDPTGGVGHFRSAPPSEEQRVPGLVSLEYLSFPLAGIFSDEFDNKPLTQLLRAGDVRLSQKRLGDQDYWVLSGRVTPWGQMEMWVDPRQEWLPVRVICLRGPDDWLANDMPIRSRPGFQGSRGSDQMVGDRIEYNVKKTHRMQGRSWPEEFTIIRQMRFASQRTITNRIDVVISEIRTQPEWRESPFQFTTVPEGTPFTDLDNPQFKYRFSDGKIVKVVQEESLERLRGNRFQRGRWWNRGLVLIVGFSAVILLVAGFVAWRRRRAAE